MKRKATWYAKLSGGGGLAVDAMTARLMGARARPELDRLRSEVQRLRAAAEMEPKLRALLLAEAARIDEKVRTFDEPKVGPAAERRARRALERAKWEWALRQGR